MVSELGLSTVSNLLKGFDIELDSERRYGQIVAIVVYT